MPQQARPLAVTQPQLGGDDDSDTGEEHRSAPSIDVRPTARAWRGGNGLTPCPEVARQRDSQDTVRVADTAVPVAGAGIEQYGRSLTRRPNVAFDVTRLGIPTSSSSSSGHVRLRRAPGATRPGPRAPSERSPERTAPELTPPELSPPECVPDRPSARPPNEAGSVRYIQIPKHSLQDFRAFARGIAAEACEEVAVRNPYVQALCKHRADLQAPSLDVPSSDQTVAQQLGTQSEALSEFIQHSMLARSKDEKNCMHEASCGETPVPPPRPCGFFRAPLVSCCTSDGEVGEVLVVEPLLDPHAGDRRAPA